MRSSDHYEFLSQPKILSGACSLEHLPVELETYDAVKPLVLSSVSDKGRTNKTFIKAMYDSKLIIGALFDQVPETAGIGIIRELAGLFRDRGCDSIVGIGGGAVMDVARGVNLLVSNRTDDLLQFAGIGAVPAHLKPLAWVATAWSGGRECTATAVIDNREFTSPFLFPELAILDARLTRGCCSACVAESGMIALTHAIEAADQSTINAMIDAYAHGAIQFASENLATAVKRPGNKKACLAIANAAMMGGICFANAQPGMVHLAADVLARRTGHPAGLLMGILLPWSMELRLQRKQLIRNELLLAMAGLDTYAATPMKDRAPLAVQLMRRLQRDLKGAIPDSLQTLRIPRYLIEEAAANAAKRGGGLFTEAECLLLLTNASGMPN